MLTSGISIRLARQLLQDSFGFQLVGELIHAVAVDAREEAGGVGFDPEAGDPGLPWGPGESGAEGVIDGFLEGQAGFGYPLFELLCTSGSMRSEEHTSELQSLRHL